MSEFKREIRYFIIKTKELDCLSTEQKEQLSGILHALDLSRKSKGKPDLECVVVESDWPEYEIVWKMIEDRVSGNTRKESETKAQAVEEAASALWAETDDEWTYDWLQDYAQQLRDSN